MIPALSYKHNHILQSKYDLMILCKIFTDILDISKTPGIELVILPFHDHSQSQILQGDVRLVWSVVRCHLFHHQFFLGCLSSVRALIFYQYNLAYKMILYLYTLFLNNKRQQRMKKNLHTNFRCEFVKQALLLSKKYILATIPTV